MQQKEERRRGEDGGRRRREKRKEGGVRRRRRSEGGEGEEEQEEEEEELRWRLHLLEKEKLELTSTHNQEVCALQVELTRLRSLVERGEVQRAELQYQLTVSQRDAARAAQLTHTLTGLQQEVVELQEKLKVTHQAREQDQHALQQEVEERDQLIRSVREENTHLTHLIKEQEETLQESQRRMEEVKKEKEKDDEVKRRQEEEIKYLTEREERSRRETELSDQRRRCLESSVEAERASHLETKFNSEVVQLRVRDLEVALVLERSVQQETQSGLDLLRSQLREVEQEQVSTERAQQRLQEEYDRCRTELTVALETERKTTSDLTERLEEERRRHGDTHTHLQQVAKQQLDTEEEFENFVRQTRDTLQQHNNTGSPAKDDGKLSPPEVLQLLETTLSTWRHTQETSDAQLEALQESQQVCLRLEQEVTRLRQESSDWSEKLKHLQEEKEAQEEETRRRSQRHQEETQSRLSSLYRLYQRLVAGCVLLHQPQSIMGDFTWEELSDVIGEQVDQLTSDLSTANAKVAHLQGVCAKKSVCVRELQRSQECVLSRLEESVRRREEAWSSRHTHTVTQLQDQLQSCRSHCASLRSRVSSLTSDLSRLRGDLSVSRRAASSYLAASALLGGALRHTHLRLQTLCSQKSLVCGLLREKEEQEEELRRLAAALEGEEEEEEKEQEEAKRRSRAVRRWRRSVCVVSAVRRWRLVSKETTVMFRVGRGGAGGGGGGGGGGAGGGGAVGVCVDTATHEGQLTDWLSSQSLSSIILSSTADLQGALSHTGSAPPDLVMSAARSALSRLLHHLLDQSEAASVPSAPRAPPPRTHSKVAVATLQRHFLLFSQRLHSAEVERRSLRVEVTNLRRGLRREKEGGVPAQRYHSVCVELCDALAREQEAHTLAKEQSNQLHTHTAQHNNTQHTLRQTAQSLSEALQEVSKKERSLRILGKHLSVVQRERKELEEQVREANRCKVRLISDMKAAETNYNQIKETLVQSRRSLSAQPRPLPLPWQHVELGGAESIMGAPELAACQSLLSTFSQLYVSCRSLIGRLEEEVSAHHSHVTALRTELHDACLRGNQVYTAVS